MPSPLSQADQGQAPLEYMAAVHSIESATTATESTASVPQPLTGSKQPLPEFAKARRDERRRVATDIGKLLRSCKLLPLTYGARVERLLELREKNITAAEQDGRGSIRTRYSSEANEKEEHSWLIGKYSDFIRDGKSSPQANKVVSVKQRLGCSGDIIGVEASDKDDEEEDYIKEELKQEFEDGTKDSSCVAEPVASVAITRGFANGRSEVSLATQASTARRWKKIGGKWMVVPRASPQDMPVSSKRKLEDVDRERESKMARLH